MEKHYDVVPIGVMYICDICKEGEMIPTERNDWSSDPPLFEHSCNKCEGKEKFDKKYPLIKFEKVV
jgi:hypothetical protein